MKASDLVQKVRDLVYGGVNDEFNRLSKAYLAGDGSLEFEFEPRGITFGSTVSVGLNTFLVWTMNPLAKTAEVTGGHDGSLDADAPLKSLVRVRPRATDKMILDAINRDLRLMSSPDQALYRVATWNPVVDVVSQAWTVPAPHDVMERVLAIRYADVGTPERWIEADGTLFTSDEEKRVVMSTFLSPSGVVEVTYAAPFGQFTSLDDDVADVGLLTEGLVDIPVFGAAASLSWSAESRRNLLTAQSDTRRPDEVPAGALTGTAREFARQRQVLVAAEATRLQRAYPYRRRLPWPV